MRLVEFQRRVKIFAESCSDDLVLISTVCALRTCLPLLRVDEIEDRQRALQFFNDRLKLVEECRRALKGLPDIEKLMSAIHSAGVRLINHPENRAVYYEQASNAKAKISRLVSCLEGLTTVSELVSSGHAYCEEPI